MKKVVRIGIDGFPRGGNRWEFIVLLHFGSRRPATSAQPL
jgi:hypothetical protein